MSATNAYNTNRLYWTTQFQQYIRFVLQGVQVTIDNTNRLYCRWFKLPPTIQTVCIVIDNTNRLYCSWLAIQTVCIVVGLQYKLFVLSAPQYKPFVLSSMQYKLFVLQLRATIQTVCIAGGSSYHTCGKMPSWCLPLPFLFFGSLARKVCPERGKPVGTCHSCWQKRPDLKEMNLGGTYHFLPWNC